jgi:hypothetical protein
MLSGAVAGMNSCSLDYPPKVKMGSENVETPTDAAAVRSSMYRYARLLFSGQANYWADYQADLVNETNYSGNRGGFFYRWTNTEKNLDFVTDWEAHYQVISKANFMLTNIDDIIASYPANAAALKNYKGEALLLRAMAYRHLALRYCKDYEPASAATDYGVPVKLDFDPVSPSTGRENMQALYKQITDDIAAAEALITTAGSQNAVYLTRDCVNAFKAQVYLDMHNYDGVIAAVNALGSTYPLIASKSNLEAMWLSDTSTETIFQFQLTSLDLAAAMQSTDYYQLTGTLDGVTTTTAGYIPEQWVVDLYDRDNDYRWGLYLYDGWLGATNEAGSVVRAIQLRKFFGNTDLRVSSTSPNYYNKPKVFRMAEMLLSKAEAQALKSAPDYVGAMTTLEELRASRGLAPITPVPATQDAVMKAIRDERVREMIGEGGRLPDIKRWKLTVTRDSQSDMPLGPGGHTMTIKWDDDKILWPIPQSEFGVNPAISGQQNPGWAAPAE